MGISLSRLNGRDAVAVLTSDARMALAAPRAGNLTRTAADRLNLPGAEDLGYRWRPELYPRVLDLDRAPDRDLRELLGTWPLPTRRPRGVDERAARPRR
jgi:hypothetical protein